MEKIIDAVYDLKGETNRSNSNVFNLKYYA
jgi:hypothetical protein